MKPIKLVFTLLVFIVSFAGFGNFTADPDRNSTTDQTEVSQDDLQSVDAFIADDLIITDATTSKTSEHYDRLDKLFEEADKAFDRKLESLLGYNFIDELNKLNKRLEPDKRYSTIYNSKTKTKHTLFTATLPKDNLIRMPASS